MKLARISAPLPTQNGCNRKVLERAAGGQCTFLACPEDFLDTGCLSALLSEKGIPAAWLRLGLEDADPATLLLDLAASAQDAGFSASGQTLELMRRQPGGLYGWPSLFTGLAREIAEHLPSPGALILENIHMLRGFPSSLDLLLLHFLPLLPAGSSRILTGGSDLPVSAIPAYVNRLDRLEFLLSEADSIELIQKQQPGITFTAARRLAALTGGREGLLNNLLSICALTGGAAFLRSCENAGRTDELMASAVHMLLQTVPVEMQDVLWLALQTGYIHAKIAEDAAGQSMILPDGLFQPLSGGWSHLRSAWKQPIWRTLEKIERGRPNAGESRANIVSLAAAFLERSGEYETAVKLLLDQNRPAEAAQVIVQVCEQLLDRGQWLLLSGWIERLPEHTRQDFPWLMYAEGEIAAARGQVRRARKVFSQAARRFNERNDPAGMCQSLLMESGLAAWQSDLRQADQIARKAQAAAEANRLAWHMGWAGWQIGMLAVFTGKFDLALPPLSAAEAAVAAIEDQQLSAYIHQALLLVQAQVDLQKKKASYRQALAELDLAEHTAAAQVRALIEHPHHGSMNLLSVYGWSRTPLMLKLPPPALITDNGGPSAPRQALLQNLLSGFFSLFDLKKYPEKMPSNLPAGAAQTENTAAASRQGVSQTTLNSPAVVPLTGEDRLPTGRALNAVHSAPEPRPGPAENIVPGLSAYLLGSFRLMIGEASVTNWPSGRGRAILEYLLAQGGRPAPRDVMMDLFWPESAPDAARNNLNVAVHGLRQALKSITPVPVILFDNDAYRLNPSLSLWIDKTEFERHITTARQAELQGSTAQALLSYETALSLYSGDFLADSPYEDWPIIERERLRVLYLDTLDRLSTIYFNTGQFAACINLSQTLLARDTCREDAHCRLMRSYCRQGQYYLALRQYQICAEALHRELDVAPSPATVLLYEKIRRREEV